MDALQRDQIFKGCTRPAMLLGVPITPLVLTFGVMTIIAISIHLLLILLYIPIYITMRVIVKNDDQQFRLLGLRAKCRLIGDNINRNAAFWKASAYAPVRFKKRKY